MARIRTHYLCALGRLEEEVGNMAREGLRTLVVAKKALSAEEYEDFDSRYAQLRACLLDSTLQRLMKCFWHPPGSRRRNEISSTAMLLLWTSA